MGPAIGECAEVGCGASRRIVPPCLNCAGGTGDLAHRHRDGSGVPVGNVSDYGLSVAGACGGCCGQPRSVAGRDNRVIDVRDEQPVFAAAEEAPLVLLRERSC